MLVFSGRLSSEMLTKIAKIGVIKDTPTDLVI
ncbi:hypothetical protein [Salibacterium salarium]